MKKLILSIMLLMGISYSYDLAGTIQSIHNGQYDKYIVVNGTKVSIHPYAKIEKDNTILPDTKLKFNELKVGDYVEIDLMDRRKEMVADEIEVKEIPESVF